MHKFGVITGKLAHTAISEAHVVFSFVSKPYFQKNLFKYASVDTILSGHLNQRACTNTRTKMSFSVC